MATKKRARRAESVVAAADAQAPRISLKCNIRRGTPPVFGSNVSGERQRLLVMNKDKWVNGTVLRYAFFDSGPFAGTSQLKAQVRKATKLWMDVGIGVRFEEVSDRGNAEVRVGFLAGDGHWSYVGREVLQQGKDDRTLNLDPTDRIASGAYGVDVACHELGHTLGFPHEHQNPKAGIVWDEEAVYRALSAPPNNWPREVTFSNILAKIPPDRVQGSNWDPDSIMHYPFEPGLILKPEQYYETGLTPAGGLSARDVTWVKTFYPALKKSDDQVLELLSSERLEIAPGQQRNFVLKPKTTRYYELRTFGVSDTVMVLFERDADGRERYLTGDDDSGDDRNAYIRRRLQAGKTYVVRVRLYYASDAGETALMWW